MPSDLLCLCHLCKIGCHCVAKKLPIRPFAKQVFSRMHQETNLTLRFLCISALACSSLTEEGSGISGRRTTSAMRPAAMTPQVKFAAAKPNESYNKAPLKHASYVVAVSHSAVVVLAYAWPSGGPKIHPRASQDSRTPSMYPSLRWTASCSRSRLLSYHCANALALQKKRPMLPRKRLQRSWPGLMNHRHRV